MAPFLFYKGADGEVRFIPRYDLDETPAFILSPSMAVVLDIRDRPEKVRECLEKATVRELRSMLDNLSMGIRNNTSKKVLIDEIMKYWTEIMERASEIIDFNSERCDRAIDQAQQMRAVATEMRENKGKGKGKDTAEAQNVQPFSGEGYKLSEDTPTKVAEEIASENEDNKDFILIIKCKEWSGHGMFKVSRSDTVLGVKMMMMTDKIEASDQTLIDANDPNDVLFSTCPLKMVGKDGQTMDDFMNIGHYFDRNAHGGEVEIVYQHERGVLTEMNQMFLDCGGYAVAVKEGKMTDGMVLREITNTTKKGRMSIMGNTITVYYDFDEETTVGDVMMALVRSIGMPAFSLRLKFPSPSCSLLENWQKVWAEFGATPTFELVASLKGGAKSLHAKEPRVKKDGNVLKQGMIAQKKNSIEKITIARNADVVKDVPKIISESLTTMNLLEKASERDAKGAFNLMLGKMKQETMGNDINNSPLMLTMKSNKSDLRLEHLGEAVLCDVFAPLRDLMLEVEGVYESGALTFEIIAARAFFNEKTAQWDWHGLRASIEAEILRRNSASSSIDDLTKAFGDITMKWL